MYVCLCNAVTDKDIIQAVANGACCMRHLREDLKVATQCGRCAPCAQEILNDALAEKGGAQDIAA